MRYFARLFPIVLAAVLVAGPALAFSTVAPRGAHVEAPAHSRSIVGQVLGVIASGVAALGAIRIKDTGTLANKFATRARAAATDYKDGVAQAGQDWETQTIASESNFEQGVQDAIGRKAFGKGVRQAGAAHYTKRATELGATRYAPGVDAGKDRWAANTQPYLQAIAALNLPPSGPRRSPQNMARANMVATTLGALKTGR